MRSSRLTRSGIILTLRTSECDIFVPVCDMIGIDDSIMLKLQKKTTSGSQWLQMLMGCSKYLFKVIFWSSDSFYIFFYQYKRWGEKNLSDWVRAKKVQNTINMIQTFFWSDTNWNKSFILRYWIQPYLFHCVYVGTIVCFHSACRGTSVCFHVD